MKRFCASSATAASAASSSKPAASSSFSDGAAGSQPPKPQATASSFADKYASSKSSAKTTGASSVSGSGSGAGGGNSPPSSGDEGDSSTRRSPPTRNRSVAGQSGTEKKSQDNNISWPQWSQAPKTIRNGREYVKIGEWLYTRHALEHTYQRALGEIKQIEGNRKPLGIPPSYIAEILKHQSTFSRDFNDTDGVKRKEHTWIDKVVKKNETTHIREVHDVRYKVITEGDIMISIHKNSGGKEK